MLEYLGFISVNKFYVCVVSLRDLLVLIFDFLREILLVMGYVLSLEFRNYLREVDFEIVRGVFTF